MELLRWIRDAFKHAFVLLFNLCVYALAILGLYYASNLAIGLTKETCISVTPSTAICAKSLTTLTAPALPPSVPNE